ncbi:uncharacterized protein [Diadema antillarum]|uniref:uncharacterized protein n=1 Tax=Diadema antillarum TaxID=105358 RepID=UPI003A837395
MERRYPNENLLPTHPAATRHVFGGRVYGPGPDGNLVRAATSRPTGTAQRVVFTGRKDSAESENVEQGRKIQITLSPSSTVKQQFHTCKCGKVHAKTEPKDVVDGWNRLLREGRKCHENNLRIIVFAPLLYNRSTLAPKWQKWMRKQNLIVDDSTSTEGKRAAFSRLDELEIIFEFTINYFKLVQQSDFQSVTQLMEEVERNEEFADALKVAKNNSYSKNFFDNVRTKKKLPENNTVRLLILVTLKHYWQYVHHTVVHRKDILSSLMKLSEADEKVKRFFLFIFVKLN